MPSKLISTRAIGSAPDREQAVADADAEQLGGRRVDHRRAVLADRDMAVAAGEVSAFPGGKHHPALPGRVLPDRGDFQRLRLADRPDVVSLHRHGWAAVENVDIALGAEPFL